MVYFKISQYFLLSGPLGTFLVQHLDKYSKCCREWGRVEYTGEVGAGGEGRIVEKTE